MLKMRFLAFTFEVFRQIVAIYDRTVGGHGTQFINPWNFEDDVLGQLKKFRAVDYRFGSSLTMHSKLWIHPDILGSDEPLVYFDFYHNADLKTAKEKALAEEIEANFQKAVNEFLVKNNLAVHI